MSRPVRLKPNGNFYLMMRNPADLVRLGEPVHVKRSLGTKDEDEAKVRHAEMLVRLHREWSAKRNGPKQVPHQQLVALAGIIYREFMETAADEPGSPIMWDHLMRIGDEAMSKPGGAEGWYGPSVDKVLAAEAVFPDADSRDRLLIEVNRAVQLATQQRKRQAEGDYGSDPNAGRFPKVAKDQPQAVTITKLMDLWERDHLADGKAPATPRDHRQKVKHFIAYLKHDDARSVTPKDISDWCDKLRHEEGLSAKTVADKYLSAVKAVFSKGMEKHVITDNPAEKVSRRVPKKVRERSLGFTDEEAAQILRMALIADKTNGRHSELNKLARKWLPWICAYTGARGGEIAQLRGDDFYVEFGIPTVRITPEAGTVKTGEYRLVPLHPHLIELGLLDVVKRRGAGPLFYVPNDDPRAPSTTQWGNVRGHVGTWVRSKAVGITDARIDPNHAWRHRFTTVADDVGIDPRYITAIQGHADGRASSGYGERTMIALGREIEKLPRYLS